MPLPDMPLMPYEYTPRVRTPAAYVHIVGELDVPRIIIEQDPRATAVLKALDDKMSGLNQRVDELITLLRGRTIEQSFSGETEHNDKADEDIKKDIKAFFQSVDDETIYPSDIAERFSVTYERAVALMEGLEENGEIEKA